jgi:hypothetical protein
LDKLQGQRLSVESDHPTIGALASESDEIVHILVWNRSVDSKIEFTLLGNNNDEVTISIDGIDSEHGNPFYGATAIDTFIEESTQIFDNNQLKLELEIPSQAIRLIRLDFSQE